MNNRELFGKHLAYLKSKGTFHVNCSLGIFTLEEIEMLEKWGYWFQALHEGILEPFTVDQRRIIDVANGTEKPFSVCEWAWFKYINRKKIEAKYSERLNAHYVPDSDIFYSREMAKDLHKTMFKVMKESHQSS